MSKELEEWQWVDDDPFEKLLHPSNHVDAQSFPDTSPSCEPPVCEGGLGTAGEARPPAAEDDSETVAAEPGEPAAFFDLASLEELKRWQAVATSCRPTSGRNDPKECRWVNEDPFARATCAADNANGAHPPATTSFYGSPRFENGPRPAGREPAEARACPDNPEPAAKFPVEGISEKRLIVAAESNDPDGYFDCALRLQELEEWEAAANSFRRALDVEPGREEALIGLGACLLYIEGTEEALSYFEKCVLLNGPSERALFGKAVALQKLSRYQEAEETYRTLLQITPDAGEAIANLIALSVARRDTDAVAGYSHRLLRLDSNSAVARHGLAICKRPMGFASTSHPRSNNFGFANQFETLRSPFYGSLKSSFSTSIKAMRYQLFSLFSTTGKSLSAPRGWERLEQAVRRRWSRAS